MCSGNGSAIAAAIAANPIIGDQRPPSPLDSIQPDHWLPEYTTDLLNLLNVLGRLIALEPAQADLLNRICASPLRSAEELRSAGALAMPEVVGGIEAQEQKQGLSGVPVGYGEKSGRIARAAPQDRA